ncbi:hypothetical protein EB001_10170 [bacterium]|nr:hypothetical protein [bacterium]
MANNRIYYAIQQVQLGPAAGSMTAVHGLQTVGITTNFNLEQVFEMGQLAIYQNVEAVPDIEVTLNKVLDGYPTLYVLATEEGSSLATGLTAVNPSIAGRQNARTDMRLSIYGDTNIAASGSSIAAVTCSGMYVSSVSYTFPVDGNFTEDVTLVGNNKVWGAVTTGVFGANNDEPVAAQGVARRQYLQMSSCRFPKQIPGINASGINQSIGNGSGYGAHFQNITVSCDFGREAIQELGTFAPYHRYVTFPVEVTSEFEVVAVSGDNINATESGYYRGLTGTTLATPSDTGCVARHNLVDETIFLETCEGTRIYLGTKNKLTSVNYTGGDTGGGNVSVTYSYSTFNDFVVAHSGGDFYSQLANSTYTP